MAAFLGLLAAFGYGVGDFVAGMLSRRVHFAIVAVLSGFVALAVSGLAALVTTPQVPQGEALLWGSASGVGMAIGTLALFRGLGRGRMGVVAPVSALTAAVVPVVLAVALGDRPAIIAWIGLVIAVPAIWLVSSGEHQGPEAARQGGLATSVSDGLMAGAGFALLYIGLGVAGDGSGLWPVVASEAAAVILFVVAGLAMRRTIGQPSLSRRDLAGSAAVGILAAGSSVAYFLATNAGLLSLVVVLASMYPAVTVALAIVIARESVGPRQALGLVMAAVAIILIVLG